MLNNYKPVMEKSPHEPRSEFDNLSPIDVHHLLYNLLNELPYVQIQHVYHDFAGHFIAAFY